MHEASISLSILEIVTGYCEREGYRRVESIRLKVGRASGVLPEALLFAFDAAKVGTIAEKSILIIDEIPVSGYCHGCGDNFVTEDTYVLCCPKCGNTSFSINTGRELDVVDMEVF